MVVRSSSTTKTTTTTTTTNDDRDETSNTVELTPSFTFCNPHPLFVNALLELNDGSFLSCSLDKTVKRWLRTTNDNENIQLVGTYQGQEDSVLCVIEKDDNTLITGSFDRTLKVWNKTSCECLDTLRMRSSVRCLLRTKDNSRFACGFYNGTVELRRMSDLDVLSSFNMHGYEVVRSICELDDGSFVSAADTTMKRWDEKGRVLRTFSGHSDGTLRLIELNKDVIVSAGCNAKVSVWKGECLRVLTLHSDVHVGGLEKVNDDVFVSGSVDGMIVVWNEKGDRIEVHQSKSGITAMTRLRDGSIVTAERSLIEIRQL